MNRPNIGIGISPKHQKHTDSPSHVSLVTRAGLVMSIIVGLATLSMMASMFVSESLDGDAAHINMAGALRMQSVRLSRALSARHNQFASADKVSAETEAFEQQLLALQAALGSQLDDASVNQIHVKLVEQWDQIKYFISVEPDSFWADFVVFDDFVNTIDRLVTTLQKQSEQKIRILRIIQSSSMFLILITAFISLQKMTKLIVQPMNQLVKAAQEAGKGNFSIRTNDNANNEIGVLARTINNMAEQLQAMHNRFEQRVQDKTHQLEQSNRSLELLYQTSHNLVRPKQDKNYHDLLKKIEDNLGGGELILCLNTEQSREAINWMSPISNHSVPGFCKPQGSDCAACLTLNESEHNFEIEKRGEHFGTLRYFDVNGKKLEQWQKHLLQTIADNIAVAISLDRKRLQANLIGLQEERAVIARELHDSLAQSLSFLKLQTGLLAKQFEKELARDSIEETITDIRNGLSDAYRQLRELLTTFRLRISEASLEIALKTTAIEFTQKCGHPVILNCAIDTTILSPNEQIHVLQIVREALSNIQRHARATKAEISLTISEEIMCVRITDNGVGLGKQNQSGSQHGMSIMNERANSLHGQLAVKSRCSSGTVVDLKFKANAYTPKATSLPA